MGILNLTPDSFSDGGRWAEHSRALDHAYEMLEAGADLIDIGGESTRPHSTRITPGEEWDRIREVVTHLVNAGVVVSVDTLHAETARRCAQAGVAIINDVSGGMWDSDMNTTVAHSECAYVIQRFHALPGDPNETFDHGHDVVATVLSRVLQQIEAACEAGVPQDRIIVDPGLGFSLTNEQCWEIVHQTDRLCALGYPVLIGASRKRFLSLSPIADRDEATVDITARVAKHGVWGVRVHDVPAHVACVRSMGQEKTGGVCHDGQA
ncbi:dihydropteroate synthase [Schaalia sp. lx-260]|uniref:dihydropteroate synthase n=1 Tax=Schaalia sp. lx-260 TaxID=2899082 RepID=UPI001E476E22|nr:dihydropteroate synthase [Schaalia sp. lx-260]MCD4549974.1 dihydropteroate synthase [Schaalia sp. lx-260]